MRNKTVNSAAFKGGGKRKRADAIFLSCHRQKGILADFFWRQLVLCSWLEIPFGSPADAPNLDIYTP